nr:glycosyltransferase family 2 protein [Jeotgalibacillus malaysiensis]
MSIVVPVYNAGKKLEKCILSLIAQDMKELEIILVNDGSTDKSLNICKKYAKQDGRIKIINKNNEGSIKTRRRGVIEASSKYVMFVDADDWVDHSICTKLYEQMVLEDADVVVCNTYKVFDNAAIIKKSNNSHFFDVKKVYNDHEVREKLAAAYFHGHPFPASLFAKLYKKELLLDSGKYLDSIIFLGEDLYYNIEVLLHSKKVVTIPESLYYYRAGGLTSKYMSYLFDDMVSGYIIQKEIINEYFHDDQHHYNGISIMLLNTFKTCLSNLYKNEAYKSTPIRQAVIGGYLDNPTIKEALKNKSVQTYFDASFLYAIENRDIQYLDQLGWRLYRAGRSKRYVMKVIEKLEIV